MSTLPITILSADMAAFQTVIDILHPKLMLGAKCFAMSARCMPTTIGVADDLGSKASLGRPPLFRLSDDRSRPPTARGRGRTSIR